MVTKVQAQFVVRDAWSVYDDGPSMFPGLVHASNGDLVLSYSTMPDGLPGGEVQLTRSGDGGRTWKGEVVLVDPKGFRYTAEYQVGYPTMVNLGDDEILVVFYSYGPELPHGRYLAANLLREST